jgi:hypothetical protein
MQLKNDKVKNALDLEIFPRKTLRQSAEVRNINFAGKSCK